MAVGFRRDVPDSSAAHAEILDPLSQALSAVGASFLAEGALIPHRRCFDRFTSFRPYLAAHLDQSLIRP